jgi:hypothetical protein
MADEAGNNNVFVYMGGNQRVPRNVRYVRIHKSVKIIYARAFAGCRALETVEFGDNLVLIEESAFSNCTSLRTIKIPKVRVIGEGAFMGCEQLTDAELSEDIHTIGHRAFIGCSRLRRIAIPLKCNLLRYFVFDDCTNLSTVDLIGVHKTISSGELR